MITEVVGNIDLYCELVFDIVAGLIEMSDRVPEYMTNFSDPLEAQYSCLDRMGEVTSEGVNSDEKGEGGRIQSVG